MASLKAAPEVISSSHKSLLCLQTPEGKCFVTWDKSWGMSSEIWHLDFIFWTSVFMVLGIKTGATKGLGGLQPFICARQKQLPRPLLYPYLESLCRIVRANNSPMHFLGQGCWYPQSDRAKMRWNWVARAVWNPSQEESFSALWLWYRTVTLSRTRPGRGIFCDENYSNLRPSL